MEGREYSQRLGVITDEQFQAALDRFGLGTCVSAEPIANGLFGQNVMVRASTGDYVFRGAPHWNPAGEDDWQFQKERFFSRLVHEAPAGAPVPWPYLLDQGRDIFGWGFAFQPRVPGIALTQPMPQHYSEAEMRQQAAELGRALAGVHAARTEYPGLHDKHTDALQPLATSYADYVESVVEQLLSAAAAASSATSPEDIAWARSILAEARPALEMPFAPTVIHLDYGFHNVLFDKRDGHWQLTAVIDWHTAESGHPEADLARPLATFQQYRIAGRAEFLAAYFERRDRPPGFEQRLPVFLLWERLLIWGYWQTHNGFKQGLGMRTWMEPFVRMGT